MKIDAKETALKQMPQFDARKMLEEDKELEGLDVPFRFGKGFDVDYTLKDGVWTKQGDKRIWSLRFSSSGAYSLNFIFSELNLIPDAELYIFNADGSMVYGPVTDVQNISKGATFLTDLIAGNEVTIQLIEPVATKSSSSLRISRVVHAYKNMLPFIAEIAPGAGNALLSCHNDVTCYSAWDGESKAVAMVLLSSGDATCSGSLLNNTANDFKSYF
jgi:hypothetical protein